MIEVGEIMFHPQPGLRDKTDCSRTAPGSPEKQQEWARYLRPQEGRKEPMGPAWTTTVWVWQEPWVTAHLFPASN